MKFQLDGDPTPDKYGGTPSMANHIKPFGADISTSKRRKRKRHTTQKKKLTKKLIPMKKESDDPKSKTPVISATQKLKEANKRLSQTPLIASKQLLPDNLDVLKESVLDRIEEKDSVRSSDSSPCIHK